MHTRSHFVSTVIKHESECYFVNYCIVINFQILMLQFCRYVTCYVLSSAIFHSLKDRKGIQRQLPRKETNPWIWTVYIGYFADVSTLMSIAAKESYSQRSVWPAIISTPPGRRQSFRPAAIGQTAFLFYHQSWHIVRQGH